MSNEERATYREILRLNDLLRESRPGVSLLLGADEEGLQAVGVQEFEVGGWRRLVPLSSDFEEVRRLLGDMVALELAKRDQLAF